MKITVIGTGYVGLVTGACLAQVGNHVLCLDIDEEKISTLNDGGIPIYEPGLEDLVKNNIKAGRLAFTTDVAQSVGYAKVQFIAVGTPPKSDGSAILENALSAARSIGCYMDDSKIIVNKSTVPVGTAERVRESVHRELANRGVNLNFTVVSNPEFLKEGSAVDDFMRPDRIIIGSDEGEAIDIMRSIYVPFNRNHEKLIVMDIRSAELTKYAANAMLATRISFMNELANLAERLGADIEHVRQGIGSDPRIGYDFLYAGCGYGGSCFPKDIQALLHTARNDAGMDLNIISATHATNEHQKRVLALKIRGVLGENLRGRHFALWGLSFKPKTDDMREAPSRILIEELLAAGATISAYDPAAIEEAKKIYDGESRITFPDDPMSALEGADALAIMTEWTEFRSPDFEVIRGKLKQPLIFDGRNLYDPACMEHMGFTYHAIGRGCSLTS